MLLETITIDHIVCDFHQIEFRQKYEGLAMRLVPSEKASADEVRSKVDFFLKAGYSPFILYNALQQYLARYEQESEAKSRRAKVGKNRLIAASAFVGAILLGYSSKEIAGGIAGGILGIGAANFLYDLVGVVDGAINKFFYKKPSIISSVNSAISYLETILPPETTEPQVENLLWGDRYSVIERQPAEDEQSQFPVLIHFETFALIDGCHILYTTLINGIPAKVRSHSSLNLPVELSRAKVEAYAAMVYPYVQFFSNGEVVLPTIQ
jgi:hypothetical protein